MESYLKTIMNLTTSVINDAPEQNIISSFGYELFKFNNDLASTLVEETDSYRNISFSVQNLGMDIVSKM